MIPLPKEDRQFITKNYLLDKITALLAGRVSEEIVFGDVSTGAHNDFEQATNIARRMVTEFGMSEKIGPVQLGNSRGEVFLGRDIGHDRNYSDKIAYEVDLEIKRILTESYDRCKNLLLEKRQVLENLVKALLKHETLTAEQIKQVIENGKVDGDDEADDNGDVKVQIQSKKEEAENEENEKN